MDAQNYYCSLQSFLNALKGRAPALLEAGESSLAADFAAKLAILAGMQLTTLKNENEN